MDARHFDAITRLAATPSRRGLLAGMVAAALSGRGLRVPSHAAAAPEYDNRGQRCDGPSACNAPCRTCDDGRCVYACDADQVCDAAGTELDAHCEDVYTKGCCYTL